MSYLTQSDDELLEAVITGLEGEGFAFNRLTTELQVYLATCLGDANAWKTKSVNRMLAELNSHFSGSTVSYLTMGYAQLLDTLSITLADSGGGGDYHANAVNFSADAGAFLSLESYGGPDVATMLESVWVKTRNLPAPSETVWGFNTFFADPDNSGTQTFGQKNSSVSASFILQELANSADNQQVTFTANPSPDIADVWIHVLISVNSNLGAGLKVVQMYITDVSQTLTQHIDAGDDSAFLMGFNGKDLGIPYYGANFNVDLADPQIWLGASFVDLSVEANRRLFIDADGKPVDPAIAVAELGVPKFAFSGDAANWATQAIAQGFTVEGTPTNASTSPSD